MFPKDFFWGAATSAHQVEGGTFNDWSEWEKKSAKLKVESAKLRGGWPEYILKNYPNPLQEENYISGQACDHYHRFREDFSIAKSLGHNAHRFSIEWSRIEPEEGRFDEKEIQHYREVLLALRERGIEPFVTLWHWTLPLWLRDKGGVLAEDFPNYFARFAGSMVKEFPNVHFWITLNEPNIYCANSFLKGMWPPQKKSLFAFLSACRSLMLAHRFAFAQIKKDFPAVQIGIAQNMVYFYMLPLGSFIWNHLFLFFTRDQQDFVGVNYYTSSRTTGRRADLFKSIDPKGFYVVLREAARYKKPIYVTENGIADTRDIQRAEFIKDHVGALGRALEAGISVKGYLHWSLLDNFEWDKGFWPRFGLVEVDHQTMERKIRPSAYEYKKIIEMSRLPV